ncbi:hypothetical protein GN958_ATG09298 [Phytophthora infestans]|uniref:Uncharacterized protein n=1 Tax=Phytophthora infestans TaxID=4787 RepID=A0A8S9TXF9_PHYIN|nr:hypothetical protein GN958_ATG17657 [Phytophthora infestans]KAF4141499.1 hypothetical protein GN958_ATG09297 [Phytophthora infestans]KAF4141500.1 hypothetical protein GN958_ATG09298 [Phytophthora infestans]
MKLAQPIFEYIKPPKTDEPGAACSGEVSSRASWRILEHLAHYEFRTTVEEVTEARLQEDITRRAGTLMSDHVPDVARLLRNSLQMDMEVANIHARAVKRFMDFDQLVDDHGLMAWVGQGPVTDAADRQRMKTSCKLLISNLFPTVLRVDIERLVAVTHQQDDVALYELIVGRAKYQQHFHIMQSELKHYDPPRGKTVGSTKSGGGKQQHNKTSGKSERSKSEPKTVSAPPRSGCLVCKGPHWVKDTGAESNIVSRVLVEERQGVESGLKMEALNPVIPVQVAGGVRMVCRDTSHT